MADPADLIGFPSDRASFIAGFESDCESCGELIDTGSIAAYADGELVCADCAGVE